MEIYLQLDILLNEMTLNKTQGRLFVIINKSLLLGTKTSGQNINVMNPIMHCAVITPYIYVYNKLLFIR